MDRPLPLQSGGPRRVYRSADGHGLTVEPEEHGRIRAHHEPVVPLVIETGVAHELLQVGVHLEEGVAEHAGEPAVLVRCISEVCQMLYPSSQFECREPVFSPIRHQHVQHVRLRHGQSVDEPIDDRVEHGAVRYPHHRFPVPAAGEEGRHELLLQLFGTVRKELLHFLPALPWVFDDGEERVHLTQDIEAARVCCSVQRWEQSPPHLGVVPWVVPLHGLGRPGIDERPHAADHHLDVALDITECHEVGEGLEHSVAPFRLLHLQRSRNGERVAIGLDEVGEARPEFDLLLRPRRRMCLGSGIGMSLTRSDDGVDFVAEERSAVEQREQELRQCTPPLDETLAAILGFEEIDGGVEGVAREARGGGGHDVLQWERACVQSVTVRADRKICQSICETSTRAAKKISMCNPPHNCSPCARCVSRCRRRRWLGE